MITLPRLPYTIDCDNDGCKATCTTMQTCLADAEIYFKNHGWHFVSTQGHRLAELCDKCYNSNKESNEAFKKKHGLK